ncbi:hypothetical protein, partial [Burkholderia stagnalis]|uniref:hypothetical protein n=1 Tax=Burkholderia stagnalis TaxID=1503054 RepID=UPI001C89FF02
SESDLCRRVDNALFNRLAHKNTDRFLNSLNKQPFGIRSLLDHSSSKAWAARMFRSICHQIDSTPR